jgi:6-phosphofructokinase
MSSALAVGQSGGVTPVINASLAGVIAAAIQSPEVGTVYGMRHGVRGLLERDLVRLEGVDETFLSRLAGTPGAWLGSCRHAPDEAELERIVDRLRALSVRFYIYAGGNDSADTSARLDAHARRRGYELRVINVPKTIDNDLIDMDHCPGYATAASYVALCTRLLALDTASMRRDEPVRVIELKGRHSGWLAAAAAALSPAGRGLPLLVYLPERPLRRAQVLADVEASLARAGYAVIVISEHATDASGRPVGGETDSYADGFGHADSTAPGAWLRRTIERELGCRCRLEVLGGMQKVALLPGCVLDRREALAAGRFAVQAALEGDSGRCVTLLRVAGAAYGVQYGLTDLSRIARIDRLLPSEFVGDDGPTDAFRDWIAPLVAEVRLQVEGLLDGALSGLDVSGSQTAGTGCG